MPLAKRYPWFSQPQVPVGVDWSNPITTGLVFCAIPIGNTAIDLVTGVVGTPSGTVTNLPSTSNGGFSNLGDGIGLITTGYVDQIAWPVSNNRGATMVQNATILALAGSTEQVDGNIYCIAGNTEYVTIGDGFSLGIDSFLLSGRGNVVKAAAGSARGASSGGALGNPFNAKTHFFGYSATDNGVSGNWFYQGNAVAYSGKQTHGTTTTNRRAVINALSPVYTGATLRHTVFNKLTLFWDRAISPTEYENLYDNPWQIFQP